MGNKIVDPNDKASLYSLTRAAENATQLKVDILQDELARLNAERAKARRNGEVARLEGLNREVRTIDDQIRKLEAGE